MDSWTRWHPIDVFPCVWDKFRDAFRDGRIIAPYLVLSELADNATALSQWINDKNLHTYFVIDTDDVSRLAGNIISEYRDLIDLDSGRNQADPNVIALSIVKGFPLVTGEVRRTNIAKRHKIPDVCDDKNVEWFNVIEFMRREGWRF
jgi:hypothetical protein